MGEGRDRPSFESTEGVRPQVRNVPTRVERLSFLFRRHGRACWLCVGFWLRHIDQARIELCCCVVLVIYCLPEGNLCLFLLTPSFFTRTGARPLCTLLFVWPLSWPPDDEYAMYDTCAALTIGSIACRCGASSLVLLLAALSIYKFIDIAR